MKYLGRIAAVSVVVLVTAVSFVLLPSQSQAASTSGFKPGRIIDDNIFFNNGSMSVSQIQQFLNSKVPSCDTNGDKYHNGVRRRNYSASNPAPYTCLKNYYENPTTHANNYGSKPKPDGARSAAWLIKDAANRHGINPQVLIVFLQKEQGLVTDDWPWARQYEIAMGYGCPDTAPCDEEYYGFANQVNKAAYQLNRYTEYPQYYNHAVGNNYVRYHPNSSCGGTTVNIETAATAALYNYTPYQPNQAALNAGYGTGNSCSAYGNRNFYLFFNDWFGSTIGNRNYRWSIDSSGLYEDAAFETELDPDATHDSNELVYLRLRARNTGNQVWQQSNLKLATTDPRDRSSKLCHDSWLSCGRVAYMNEVSVAPNEVATFEAVLQMPEAGGDYSEQFNLLAENVAWFNGLNFELSFTVQPTRDFAAYDSEARTKRLDNSRISMYTDEKLHITVTVKNDTNITWPANETKLATTNPNNRISPFKDDSWVGGRASRLEGGVLSPGEFGKFNFTMSAPDVVGTYEESFGIVIEGQQWIEEDTGTLSIKVSERPEDQLPTNQQLRSNEYLMSANGKYRLVMQGDGNLVIYNGGRAIWATATRKDDGKRIVLQGDGNLVMYGSGGSAPWATRTNGKPATRLVMQNDGNLVLYGEGKAFWASNTRGR